MKDAFQRNKFLEIHILTLASRYTYCILLKNSDTGNKSKRYILTVVFTNSSIRLLSYLNYIPCYTAPVFIFCIFLASH